MLHTWWAIEGETEREGESGKQRRKWKLNDARQKNKQSNAEDVKAVTLGNTKYGVVKSPQSINPIAAESFRMQVLVQSGSSPHTTEPKRFSAVFTAVSHRCLSLARWIQSKPFHPIPSISILILSSHLNVDVPSGLRPSDLTTKTLHAILLSPLRATCPTHLIFLHLITWIRFGEQYKSWSSSSCSLLQSPLAGASWIWYDTIWYIYLVRLGFHPVAAVDRLVWKQERDRHIHGEKE